MEKVNNDFVERRKRQLADEGRNDLVTSLERRGVSESRVLPDASEQNFSRSSADALSDVRLLLSQVFFGDFARKLAEQRVSLMSSLGCMDALRSASPEDVQRDPAFYSVLFDRVRREREHRALLLRDQVPRIKRFLIFYSERRISLYDRRRVADLSREDLESYLLNASFQTLQGHPSFYWALLERFEREF